jgi:PII-like signaling protein
MKIPQEGQLLRLFLGERNRHQGRPLYEWIVMEAKKAGLSGATVLRGVMGFGANSCIHTAKIMRLSEDLPIIVEIVDTPEKLAHFLDHIDGVICEGLATLEKANIQFYRCSK